MPTPTRSAHSTAAIADRQCRGTTSLAQRTRLAAGTAERTPPDSPWTGSQQWLQAGLQRLQEPPQHRTRRWLQIRAEAAWVVKAKAPSDGVIRGCHCCPATRATRAIAGRATYNFSMISRIKPAVSLGVLPTCTPTASSASFFACAVPLEPDTIAPACPIVLPSGAVKPAT